MKILQILSVYIFLSTNFIVCSDMSIDSIKSKPKKPILQAVVFSKLHYNLEKKKYFWKTQNCFPEAVIGLQLRQVNSRGESIVRLHKFSYSDGSSLIFKGLPPMLGATIVSVPKHLGDPFEYKILIGSEERIYKV